MRALLSRRLRGVASVVVFAFAVASSAECAWRAYMTPEQMPCCAGVHGDCDMAISTPCCGGETPATDGVLATKPLVAFVPVAALLAVLATPTIPAPIAGGTFAAPDHSAASPPGVPTYLFVSSFRL